MKKKTFYTELAYVFALIIMAFSAAFMEKADFGLSMVVAPAYLIHLKVAQTLPWFTFGVSEYCFQGLLMVITVLVMRHFKLSYLFSFVTALIYGTMLDAAIALIAPLPETAFAIRVVYFTVGMLMCSLAVALFFRTYISPEVYELIVKELASKFGHIDKIKTGYDMSSLLLSVALSFLFFGFGVFEGIKWGTLICTLFNGYTISLISKLLDTLFEFKNKFSLAKYFQ